MAKYRKKPVVIEACQVPASGASPEPFTEWAEETGFYDHFTSERDETLAIHTLEGDMSAGPGDWIIKGVKGEFYPCKPDIFDKTYEPAMARPRIVCLCGSLRFWHLFLECHMNETLAGRVSLLPGGKRIGDGPDKERLDALHLKKIDMADEILVVDLTGYIGQSTRAEIEYAERAGKTIRYMSEEATDVFVLLPGQRFPTAPIDGTQRLCQSCGWVNLRIRKKCRNCGNDLPREEAGPDVGPAMVE